MDESELMASASPIVRAVAPGFWGALGTLMTGGQDRRNLESDRAIVEGMLKAGKLIFVIAASRWSLRDSRMQTRRKSNA